MDKVLKEQPYQCGWVSFLVSVMISIDIECGIDIDPFNTIDIDIGIDKATFQVLILILLLIRMLRNY